MLVQKKEIKSRNATKELPEFLDWSGGRTSFPFKLQMGFLWEQKNKGSQES